MKTVRKIEEWILLVMMLSLALATVVLGVVFYRDSYARILQSFDRQSLSIGVPVASFIDGDQHNQLAEPIPLTSLAWDAARARFTATGDQGRFYVVDSVSGLGGVDPVPGGFGRPVAAHAWIGDTAYGLAASGESLLAWHPERGSSLVPLPLRARTITVWQKGILAVGDHFHWWDPALGTWQKLGALAASWIAFQESAEGLLALRTLSGSGYEIRLIDPGSGRSRPWLPLRAESAEDDSSLKAVPKSLALGGGQLWLLAGDHLVQLVPTDATGAPVPEGGAPAALAATGSGMARGFRSQNDPIFQQYVPAMREIKRKAEVTYLYTYIYTGLEQGSTDLVYILDSTTDPENYSNIGVADAYSEEEMKHVARMHRDGRSIAGPVRRYEAWGLLKQGASPILNRAGQVKAVLGVDIEVNLILRKTRLALLQVLILGGVMMVVGGFVSVKLAREISRPLFYLKNTALRVAAGNFSDRARLGGARELTSLADSFSDVARHVEERMRELGEESHRAESQRVGSVLERRLLHSPGAPPDWREFYADGGDFADSGSCHEPGRTLAWRRSKSLPRSESARSIAAFRRIARSLLAVHKDPLVLVKAAAALFECEVFCYDWDARRVVHQIPRRSEPSERHLRSDEGWLVGDIQSNWGCHVEILPRPADARV